MPTQHRHCGRLPFFILSSTFLLVCFLCVVGCSVQRGTMLERRGQRFTTPEEALVAFKAAFHSGDPKQLVEVLGEEGRDIAVTGDDVADRAAMRRFARQLDIRAELVAYQSPEYKDEQWYKLRFGAEAWNMRFPLVDRGDGWYFAIHHGTEVAKEIRMTLNQLTAIYTLLEIFNAQKKYMSGDCDKDGVHQYARRILSTPGTCDGLYWEPTSELGASPLEQMVNSAKIDGYKVGAQRSRSYEGYVYKVLGQQGPKARGGAHSFFDGKNMTRGFAILAYPFEWNKSGAHSYLIETSARMYKKDMGFRTQAIAESMTTLNPDATWVLVDRREYGEAAENPFKPDPRPDSERE